MPREIEEKFCCPPETLTKIEGLKELGGKYQLGDPYPVLTEDFYLDTEDRRLLNRAASLRCRKRNEDELKITFKEKTVEGNRFLDREEIERGVSQEEFENLMQNGVLPLDFSSKVLPLTENRKLQNVITILGKHRVHEILRKFEETNSTVLAAEMCLQAITFKTDNHQEFYWELEIELKGQGTLSDLEYLSGYLQNLFPGLKPDCEAKYQKGMRVLGIQ